MALDTARVSVKMRSPIAPPTHPKVAPVKMAGRVRKFVLKTALPIQAVIVPAPLARMRGPKFKFASLAHSKGVPASMATWEHKSAPPTVRAFFPVSAKRTHNCAFLVNPQVAPAKTGNPANKSATAMDKGLGFANAMTSNKAAPPAMYPVACVPMDAMGPKPVRRTALVTTLASVKTPSTIVFPIFRWSVLVTMEERAPKLVMKLVMLTALAFVLNHLPTAPHTFRSPVGAPTGERADRPAPRTAVATHRVFVKNPGACQEKPSFVRVPTVTLGHRSAIHKAMAGQHVTAQNLTSFVKAA
tara:strand:+ start:986 stop:1885 length:900 start_codon:yes stop_codon:yes gene_type:complete